MLGGQGDGSFSCARLGLTGNQPATFLDMERPADGKRSMGLVEVAPHETAYLTLPQAGGQFGVEDVVPDTVRPDHIQEALQLGVV